MMFFLVKIGTTLHRRQPLAGRPAGKRTGKNSPMIGRRVLVPLVSVLGRLWASVFVKVWHYWAFFASGRPQEDQPNRGPRTVGHHLPREFVYEQAHIKQIPGSLDN